MAITRILLGAHPAVVSWDPYYHLYLVAVYDDGTQEAIDGQPADPTIEFSRLVYDFTDAASSEGPRPGQADAVELPISGNLDSVWQELQQYGQDLHGVYSYDLFSRNSNSFITSLLSQIGLDVNDHIPANVPSPSSSPGTNTVIGGDADNDLRGFGGDDSMLGGGGSDMLDGGNGNDANSGNDTLWGDEGTEDSAAPGNDSLYGRDGNDRLVGNGGNDVLDGGQGDDELFGDGADFIASTDTGDDTLLGGAGIDSLVGGHGNDSLDGGTENDQLFGLDGNDTLLGGSGNDSLVGDDLPGLVEGGNDSLEGGTGSDTLIGGFGYDTLSGGDNDDTLDSSGDANDIDPETGELYWDLLVGGSGNDKFVCGGVYEEIADPEAGDSLFFGDLQLTGGTWQYVGDTLGGDERPEPVYKFVGSHGEIYEISQIVDYVVTIAGVGFYDRSGEYVDDWTTLHYISIDSSWENGDLGIWLSGIPEHDLVAAPLSAAGQNAGLAIAASEDLDLCPADSDSASPGAGIDSAPVVTATVMPSADVISATGDQVALMAA